MLKSAKHAPTDRFLSANLSLNLVPNITRPTRITKNTATLIDNIFISQSWLGSFDSGVLIHDVSDHLPSTISLKNLKLSKGEPIKVTSRDTRLKNIKGLQNSLNSINWSELHVENASNENMLRVHEKLTEEMEHYTPVKTYCVKSRKARHEPWLTAGIHISIHKNKKLYNASLHKKADKNTQIRYRTYAKMLQRVKQQAKLMYYETKYKTYKHNTKRLWGIINEICAKHNDKSCLIDCLKRNDVLEYNASKITNKFGEYFSNVGKAVHRITVRRYPGTKRACSCHHVQSLKLQS